MLNRSTLNQALKAKAGCLTDGELEKLIENPLLTNSHLVECPRCQSELALLKSFESSEPLAGEGAAVSWISSRLEKNLNQIKNPGLSRAAAPSAMSWFSRLFERGSIRWLVPASAALLVAVTSFLWLHRSQEPQLRAEAGNGPVVFRSEEVATIAPTGELSQVPQELRWKPVASAAQYQASIMEVDEVPLWTGKTHDQFLTIPEIIRGKILPAKTVLWRVTALDNQGRVLAVSQMQRFSVQRRSPSSIDHALPR